MALLRSRRILQEALACVRAWELVLSTEIFYDPTLVCKHFALLFDDLPTQDMVEHRFSIIRGINGSHKNPTAQEAKIPWSVGNVCRAANGEQRRNASRDANARDGEDFDVADTTGELMLAVAREEANRQIRASSRNSPREVLVPQRSGPLRRSNPGSSADPISIPVRSLVIYKYGF